jgi:hypothetical protein
VSEAIAGFTIAGERGRTVLIRGIGPGLAQFPVPGTLADPQIALFTAQGSRLGYENDDWTPELAAMFARVGAFALEPGSRDAALLATLNPGSYTVHLTGKTGAAGVGLIEIYEYDNRAERLPNLSTRSIVDSATAVIAGFSVQGSVAKRVLVRAVGPGLTGFGNALANPLLSLKTAAGMTVAENDDWSATTGSAAVLAAANTVGAFPLTFGSRDAALLVTVEPGNYTAVVETVSGASGVALVEVYEVP